MNLWRFNITHHYHSLVSYHLLLLLPPGPPGTGTLPVHADLDDGVKDQNVPENLLKVDEEIQGVGDVVLVSASRLPDYQLGVVSNEATEHSQPNPDLDLYKIMIGSMSRPQCTKTRFTWKRSGDLRRTLRNAMPRTE